MSNQNRENFRGLSIVFRNTSSYRNRYTLVDSCRDKDSRLRTELQGVYNRGLMPLIFIQLFSSERLIL